ncbi:hypothetical protein ARMSODRAFT_1038191 [Armillaria solidipes]|uniref:Uncharacterized protein n=1 Tax=Armillaria solidipes TaxID=1076256 RepID=A0A2H3BTW9_9AGAR|nr:hypothetical protein ARMSODRAFT_1038191 [Armillaria solidipes]
MKASECWNHPGRFQNKMRAETRAVNEPGGGRQRGRLVRRRRAVRSRHSGKEAGYFLRILRRNLLQCSQLEVKCPTWMGDPADDEVSDQRRRLNERLTIQGTCRPSLPQPVAVRLSRYIIWNRRKLACYLTRCHGIRVLSEAVHDVGLQRRDAAVLNEDDAMEMAAFESHRPRSLPIVKVETNVQACLLLPDKGVLWSRGKTLRVNPTCSSEKTRQREEAGSPKYQRHPSVRSLDIHHHFLPANDPALPKNAPWRHEDEGICSERRKMSVVGSNGGFYNTGIQNVPPSPATPISTGADLLLPNGLPWSIHCAWAHRRRATVLGRRFRCGSRYEAGRRPKEIIYVADREDFGGESTSCVYAGIERAIAILNDEK